MLPIVRSRLADQDLDRISQSIASHDPLAAFRWLEELDKTIGLAAKFPAIGESVEHYGPGVRRLSQGSYVILFCPHPKHLELARVLHGSRDIDTLLD